MEALERDVSRELAALLVIGAVRLRARGSSSRSPSVSLEVLELGGDVWPLAPNTRSAGARVRNVGPRVLEVN